MDSMSGIISHTPFLDSYDYADFRPLFECQTIQVSDIPRETLIKDGVDKSTRIMYQIRQSWGVFNDTLFSSGQGNVDAVDVILHMRGRAGKVYRITQESENV